MVFVLLFADTAFTAVAGNILASAGKFVNGQTAVVGTAYTVGHGGFVFQGIDFLYR